MQKNNVKLYKNDWKILIKIPKYGKNRGTKNKENINEQTDVATDEEILEAQEGDELKNNNYVWNFGCVSWSYNS